MKQPRRPSSTLGSQEGQAGLDPWAAGPAQAGGRVPPPPSVGSGRRGRWGQRVQVTASRPLCPQERDSHGRPDGILILGEQRPACH